MPDKSVRLSDNTSDKSVRLRGGNDYNYTIHIQQKEFTPFARSDELNLPKPAGHVNNNNCNNNSTINSNNNNSNNSNIIKNNNHIINNNSNIINSNINSNNSNDSTKPPRPSKLATSSYSSKGSIISCPSWPNGLDYTSTQTSTNTSRKTEMMYPSTRTSFVGGSSLTLPKPPTIPHPKPTACAVIAPSSSKPVGQVFPSTFSKQPSQHHVSPLAAVSSVAASSSKSYVDLLTEIKTEPGLVESDDKLTSNKNLTSDASTARNLTSDASTAGDKTGIEASDSSSKCKELKKCEGIDVVGKPKQSELVETDDDGEHQFKHTEDSGETSKLIESMIKKIGELYIIHGNKDEI